MNVSVAPDAAKSNATCVSNWIKRAKLADPERKLAKQLVEAANWVKMQSDEGEINPIDVLRWPSVMSAQEQDLTPSAPS